MGDRQRTRLDWKTRSDGSLWAQCQIGGEPAVIALTETVEGQLTATAIVEIESISAFSAAEDALKACEFWLLELGASPHQRSAITSASGTGKKPS